MLVRQENNAKTSADADEICELLLAPLRRAVDLAKEKGASTWLTALPLVEHGFTLHKGAFHDLALSYGWTPSEMPSMCTCGSKFSVEHALSCAKGGFPSIRHNAPSNRHTQLPSCYRKHEQMKKRTYEQRIREVEHASFTPGPSDLCHERTCERSQHILQKIGFFARL